MSTIDHTYTENRCVSVTANSFLFATILHYDQHEFHYSVGDCSPTSHVDVLLSYMNYLISFDCYMAPACKHGINVAHLDHQHSLIKKTQDFYLNPAASPLDS